MLFIRVVPVYSALQFIEYFNRAVTEKLLLNMLIVKKGTETYST
jgi:hypothetical protein